MSTSPQPATSANDLSLGELRLLLDELEEVGLDEIDLFGRGNRWATQYRIGKRLLGLGESICSVSRERADLPAVHELLQAIDLMERAKKGSSRIAAASTMVALAEKLMLQLIGEAVASSTANWAQIGQSLRRLDSTGSIGPARITRQAARQRFSKHAVVEESRLVTECKKLRRDISGLARLVASVEAENATKRKAENVRQIAAMKRAIHAREALLQNHISRLDNLRAAGSSSAAVALSFADTR